MIALVGFMGAGKSTVGQLLAQRLGVPFADADAVVEERTGCSVAEIFETAGEPAFRALEESTIDELLCGTGVLALGGGALGSVRVRAALAGHDVVHLAVSLEEARRRVGDDPARPMLARHDIGELHAAREAAYARVATHVVPADVGDADVVAARVARALSHRTLSHPGGIVSPRSRVVLVGPPGSGTSTVGALVASRLGLDLADVDDVLAAQAGRSVGELFVDEGEARFRELEREVALGLLGSARGVVVLGGGAVLDEQVQHALVGATVVLLDVGIADAAKRIGFDAPGLVLLNPRRSWIVQMERRRPVYQQVATWTIDTAGRSAQDVADALVGLVEGEEA